MEAPGQPTPSPGTPPSPTPPTPGPTPQPPPPPAAGRHHLATILELATALRPSWPTLRADARASGLTAEGEGDAAGEGDEGAAGEGEGDKGGDAGAAGWTPPTKAEWEAQQAELNTAKQGASTKAREAREAQRKLDDATGKGESAEDRLKRLEGSVAKTAVDSTIEATAKELGFRSPKLALRLIDRAGINAAVDIEGDEVNATVDEGAKAVIKQRLEAVLAEDGELAAARPGGQLPGAGSGDGKGGAADGGNGAMNAAIRQAAGRG